MGVLSHLEPQEVFNYFEEICAIPHASYQESKISEYCAAFAKKHGLECYQDEWKNVVIIKEAAKGYEKEPTLILQGHLDMVCEKDPGSDFAFETDGLRLIVDGDHITANGTTLGGDDGIAIAYMLAVLASETIAHPRLEAVFTVSEETGMEGAAGIDVSMLRGKRLLNLDSEEEGFFLAGCAGGASVICRLPVNRIAASGELVKITVSGLAGGHSGMDINRGRANANILMGRVLQKLTEHTSCFLACLEGGGRDNVIPGNCMAALYLDPARLEAVKQIIADMRRIFAGEYAVTDKNIRLCLECGTQEDLPQLPAMLDAESTARIVRLVNTLPNGVQAMSAQVEGMVETSLNLGVMRLESEQAVFRYSVRSSMERAKEALLAKLRVLTEETGGTSEVTGIYPAWEYKKDSVLRKKLVSVYEQMYGSKPVIQVIHAGLECGLLAEKIPGLDCVSIGPDLIDIHTTNERLCISSAKRVWEFLLQVLQTK